jgi:hypothetical protein
MDLFTRNPFLILELTPKAGSREIERQGRKILAMLDLAVRDSTTYPTAWGQQERNAADVRQAMAELADPCRFHFHAFWLPATVSGSTVSAQQPDRETGFDLLQLSGFSD